MEMNLESMFDVTAMAPTNGAGSTAHAVPTEGLQLGFASLLDQAVVSMDSQVPTGVQPDGELSKLLGGMGSGEQDVLSTTESLMSMLVPPALQRESAADDGAEPVSVGAEIADADDRSDNSLENMPVIVPVKSALVRV